MERSSAYSPALRFSPLRRLCGRRSFRAPLGGIPRYEKMTEVSHIVRSRLEEVLPVDQAVQAISQLEQTVFPLAKVGSDLEKRVHLGIVMLVCEPPNAIFAQLSPRERFEEAIALAEVDWRDLLVAAGLENEDWREVLIKAGYVESV